MKRSSAAASLVAAALAAALVLAACSAGPTPPPAPSPTAGGSPPPSASASPSPSASPSLSSAERNAGWRSDLTMLLPAMAAIHPKLDHGTSRATLDAAVSDLAAAVPTLSDDAVMVGVLRIVALVSADGCDAHTGAFIWGTGTYPVDSLPLRIWSFEDGVVIVDALSPYGDLIGARIDAIDGHPIGAVLDALDPLIPRDNDSTVRLLTPRYLLIAQVLRGLGLAGGGPVELALTARDGTARTVPVAPIPMAGYNTWAGPYGLHLPLNADVLYLSRIGDALWWERFDDGTLFVQYNRVDVLPQATLDGLNAALHEPGVAGVILDVRHNYGGEVSALDAILHLFQDAAVDRTGRLFVITGRNTFSAASLLVARLDATTSASFVGEPMGGCPTAYGDSSDVTLPFSGLLVSVSGTLEIGVSATDTRQTIEPDMPAPLSADEWAAGADPALAAILGTGP